jgi:hypothetical protein
MSSPRKPDPRRRPSAPRSYLLGVAAVFLLALIFILSGHSAPAILVALTIDGSLLLLWLLAAAGYGSLILVPASPLRKITEIALGIGIISTLQLLLGLAGALHRPIAFAIIAVGIACFFYYHRSITRDAIKQWLAEPAKSEWLWLIAIPILAMAITAAYVPPGILWGDEPHGYDVLEYHLQLPREWLELGRIVPLGHNAFSYFPLAVEMHYLLAMQLEGGPWAGMYLAQLMHVAMIALTVIAIYGAARGAAPKFPSILAALSAASVPWLLLLAPVAYNEGGLLLFGTLAIAWLLHAQDRKAWLIAGVCAGFACGTKLTAVPQLLILVPLIAWPTLRAKPINVAAYVVAGTLVFSPWLIRNLIWTGNPVFPEAQSVFGRAHFSQQQQERWHRAHAAANARLPALGNQILFDWRFGYVLLPAGVVAALFAFRRRETRLLLALLLAWLILWVGYTHLQGRFFVLAIPVAAFAIVATNTRAFAIVATIQIAVGVIFAARTFNERVSPTASAGILGFTDLKRFLPEDVQEDITREEPIALIGDAKAFLYPLPTSKLHYKTVFDVEVKPNQSIIDAWAQSMPANARKTIDRGELVRFSDHYYGITKPD